MSEMSRETFAEEVIRLVRERFPLMKVSRADQPFSLRVNGIVASLENLYRSISLKPEEMPRIVERWALELLRAGEGTPDQTGIYEQVKDRILPMVLNLRGSEKHVDNMVFQPMVLDLVVAYAIDGDRTISYVSRQLFKQWNVSMDELHETSIRNLVRRSENINAHAAQDSDGRINLILFQTMDGFDGSRLLLPTLHERLKEHLGAVFGAAVPNRDILLCFRNDEETVERLREQISNDYRSMPHPVTDELLLITADGIAPRDSTSDDLE
jgi:uncharacterized protein YtpQ (UPF0354 family)